ncbi:MAG: DUF2125 domain-containing protein [Gemmobacter sp.]|jgi:hypothetical protein|nr:DUF2125 domain-containing protein [Gemmobacter sp.]
MAQWKFMGTTAVAALLIGNAALADVTPEQVWENWKALSTSQGSTMTTQSESREGDTLIVRGVSAITTNPQIDVTATMDELRLRDRGDGSVEMTMSDSAKVVLRAAGAEGEGDTLITLGVGHPGLVTTVSGTAEEMRHDLVGPTVKVTVDDIQGPDMKPADVQVEAVVTNLTGSSLVTGTAERTVTSNFAADGLTLTVRGTDPADDSNKVDANLTMTGLSGLSTSKLVGDMADLPAALRAGTAMEGSFSFGGANAAISVIEADAETKMTGSNAGGDLTFAMSAAGLTYGGGAREAKVSISGDQIPVPQVDISYKEAAFNLVMPILKSDSPSDFAFLTRVVDLTISDEIWAMFDPTSQLPRDPVTVVLDTKGTATLNADLTDEAALAGLDGAPGELHSLDLNALQLKIAGAELTGDGALTFDNTDTTTFEGVPAPSGKVNLMATGVNGLLDKLMAMGLVPEDQMMGARMMLGMFAKVDPATADTMTSEIEFTDKHLFVNGMQIQ